MRRIAVVLMAVVGVSLAFGLSLPSARNPAPGDPVVIGPGFGGIGPSAQRPVRFLGVTTQRFPAGIGILIASRACNEEHPISRLCERGELLRAIPPAGLDSEMLVAPSFSTNPVPVCMNMNGAPRCMPSPAMKPAACCGYPTSPIATLTLDPADNQTVNDCGAAFDFTATAYDINHAPLAGVTIVFDSNFLPGSLPLVFRPASGVAAGDGTVRTTASIDPTLCANHCTGTLFECGFTVQARDEQGLVYSNPVQLIDDIP
jgi:hypothetical protein